MNTNDQTLYFITNAKQYPQAIGDDLMPLAIAHERVSKEYAELNIKVGIAVPTVAIATVEALAPEMLTLAQHVDAVTPGSRTGAQLPEAAAWAGAWGTLLNHSERRIVPAVEMHVQRAKEAGLQVVLCAESPAEVGLFAPLKPDFIAFEPPELIGSTDASVATAKPESITKAVEAAAGIPLLVGAGIRTEEDIRVSLELGARGFLVASAIVKAQNPEESLRALVSQMAG